MTAESTFIVRTSAAWDRWPRPGPRRRWIRPGVAAGARCGGRATISWVDETGALVHRKRPGTDFRPFGIRDVRNTTVSVPCMQSSAGGADPGKVTSHRRPSCPTRRRGARVRLLPDSNATIARHRATLAGGRQRVRRDTVIVFGARRPTPRDARTASDRWGILQTPFDDVAGAAPRRRRWPGPIAAGQRGAADRWVATEIATAHEDSAAVTAGQTLLARRGTTDARRGSWRPLPRPAGSRPGWSRVAVLLRGPLGTPVEVWSRMAAADPLTATSGLRLPGRLRVGQRSHPSTSFR